LGEGLSKEEAIERVNAEYSPATLANFGKVKITEEDGSVTTKDASWKEKVAGF
jgi:hypothetical protein